MGKPLWGAQQHDEYVRQRDEAIERRADVIVMAAKNRVKHGKITMGETVAYILKNAPCDVLVVRLAQNPPAEWRPAR